MSSKGEIKCNHVYRKEQARPGMERQMVKQTGEKTRKTCWLIICFRAGAGSQKQPRNAVFAQA